MRAGLRKNCTEGGANAKTLKIKSEKKKIGGGAAARLAANFCDRFFFFVAISSARA